MAQRIDVPIFTSKGEIDEHTRRFYGETQALVYAYNRLYEATNELYMLTNHILDLAEDIGKDL